MIDAIIFFMGIITMGIVWFISDYYEPTSAYHRGYKRALKDMQKGKKNESD